MKNLDFLSAEGYAKLQGELDYRRTIKRAEILKRLQDFLHIDENVIDMEYQLFKDEQGFNEGRIQVLERLLGNFENKKRFHSQGDNGKVELGSIVTIQEEEGDLEKFFIVSTYEANSSLRRISDESPLGFSLIGHQVGDIVEVISPKGTFRVQIMNIE
jgi:transcription elongation factor GreA